MNEISLLNDREVIDDFNSFALQFIVSASATELDFGTLCRGETTTRDITLTNSGVLTSHWQVRIVETIDRTANTGTTPSTDINPSPELVVAQDFTHTAAAHVHHAITLVTATDGFLSSNECMTIQLRFAPMEMGAAQARFEVHFLDQDVPPITLHVTGECTDLPVQLERTVANMLTCQMGRVYYDNVVVCNNHASTAVKVQFELPPECQKFFEFSPRNAFLPAMVCLFIHTS